MALAGNIAMEVERLLNLAGGFGWEKQKEEMVGQHIEVTVRKKIISDEVNESAGEEAA